MHGMQLKRCLFLLLALFTINAACSNGAVQLVGGQSSNEGRLEYCYNGAWTQVLSNKLFWTLKRPVATCRQLGYTTCNPGKNL